MRRDSEEYLDLCCAAGYGTVSYKVAKAVMKEIELDLDKRWSRSVRTYNKEQKTKEKRNMERKAQE
jgi:hypothetical protein